MTKTPMMRQFDEAKKACGDALLFFRMGDFYELFHDDAKVAAKELGLTLTSRDKANTVPMAGFPYHQLDSYLGKLIKRGFRVAVCDQVEDPKTAVGIVKREIQQIVSPGTLTDQALLDPSQSNYLISVNWLPEKSSGRKRTRSTLGSTTHSIRLGVSWADLSTGEFVASCGSLDSVADLLTRLNASEILIPDQLQEQESIMATIRRTGAMVTPRPDWCFGTKVAQEKLEKQFQVATLDGFGIDQLDESAMGAAGAVVDYLQETQKASLGHFNQIKIYQQNEFVEIDAATWRSLEISQTIRSGERQGSLFGVMDRSATPMGSRMLGNWLANPLRDADAIRQRQDAVEFLFSQPTCRNQLLEDLKTVYDLRRLVSRVATGRTSPRDLLAIAKTLAAIPTMKRHVAGTESQLLNEIESQLDDCEPLKDELFRALNDPCPNSTRDGGYIQQGYDNQLDELRAMAAGGKQWIAKYQKTICEQTGIPSIKVGFNKVFGYYLEVTHTHRDKVPEDFIRKQTLKNVERFITPELKEYEEKVVSAEAQVESLELELFERNREQVRQQMLTLKNNAELIAKLDALCGLAQLAVEQRYVRPEIGDGITTNIIEGRHPVLDIVEPLGAFVPNDTNVDSENGILHLITGPNMAGKSTYIRQVALISLLAQIGSFVPAEKASLGIVDKIFARVGASDELSKGQSTFMVEMTETARILNTATESSLVILDEIGRGTSTYDGVSLAWAIAEFLHDKIGCRTLFATHYHELTSLAEDFHGIANFNVAVREWEDKIVFLHKIVPGCANKSYGIHVARIAGVPDWVNQRAEQILKNLESQGDLEENREKLTQSSGPNSDGTIQMMLFGPVEHPLVDKIKALDANALTPLNALETIFQWQDELATDAPAESTDDSPDVSASDSLSESPS